MAGDLPVVLAQQRESFLLVAGATLTLDDATLDRIDEIVPPGTNRYNPNAAFPPRALTDTARRRRPLAERAAA